MKQTPKTFLMNAARHAKRMGWTEDRFHAAIAGIKPEHQHLIAQAVVEYNRFKPRKRG